MGSHLRDIVILLCTVILVTYSRPIDIDKIYQFWKTVDKQSIPQTQALQQLLSLTIESFCETDEIRDSIKRKNITDKSCDEYIQSLSSVTPAETPKHINNPNKFMKVLIINTVKNLDGYAAFVQLMADEYDQSRNCQDGICIRPMLNSISTNLNKLIQSIASKAKEYFQIKNVKKRKGRAISIKDKQPEEKVAILYDLFTQLKEAESVLEFVVKSTWEVHIRQLTNFTIKKKRRKSAQKFMNLKL